MSGWIKLYRDLLKWEWFDDHKVCHFFIYCLLKASHNEKKWRGKNYLPGQFPMGLHKASIECGLSIRSIRTAINKLKSTNELTSETSPQGTVITIIKWGEYQLGTNTVTNERQTSDKRATTTKNVKNVKKKRNTTPSFDFEALYKKYPKKQGKSLGLKKLAKIIKTQKQYDDFEKAVNNLKIVCKDRLPKHMPHFSTFVNSLWEDYVDDEVLQDTTEYQKKKNKEELINFLSEGEK